jgi:hypothetical protein
MRRYAGVLIFGVVLAAVFAYTASAQTGNSPAPGAGPTTGQVVDMLAPLLAAATGVERLLEMAWNWFETLFLNLIAFIAMGWEWTRWAREEIAAASQAVNDLAAELERLRYGRPGQPRSSAETSLLAAMANAEKRLMQAQDRLQGVLKSERYRRIKQALSVLAGIGMGLVIAAAANLKMFVLLGITIVPGPMDIFITGLVIGTGAGPVHSLIGILQQGKDALEGTSLLLRGRSSAAASESASKEACEGESTSATG